MYHYLAQEICSRCSTLRLSAARKWSSDLLIEEVLFAIIICGGKQKVSMGTLPQKHMTSGREESTMSMILILDTWRSGEKALHP